MRQSTVAWDAPRDTPAASTAGSSRRRLVQTDRTMNGTSTCTSATVMPVKLYMNSIGRSRMPSFISATLTMPPRPRSTAQPRVRTITETSSGPRITRRKIERHGGRMRWIT